MPSSTLKILAIIAMACNHAAYVFAAELPPLAYIILIAVGGITFPLMVYLLAEGYRHTSNLRRYLTRLVVFAVISQVPYGMVLAPGATPLGAEGNVLFALALGLIVMWADDKLADRIPALVATVLGCLIVSLVINWGPYAVVMSLLFKRLHEYTTGDQRLDAFVPLILLIEAAAAIVAIVESGSVVAIASLAYSFVGALGSTALLTTYNGERGLRLKWFFYVFYPAHIAVLGLVHLLLF